MSTTPGPMSTTPTVRSTPRRLTRATLTAGVAVAAVCFLVAGTAELLGNEGAAGDMTDLAAVVDGLLAFSPWAWATLGTYVILATPAIGLATTAYEYASIAERRAMAMALVVLAVLGVSLLAAIVR
jgi:uncharacterized membrane protein